MHGDLEEVAPEDVMLLLRVGIGEENLAREGAPRAWRRRQPVESVLKDALSR